VALLAGVGQGRAAVLVEAVDVGLVLEEERHDVRVAALDGDQEREPRILKK
jgi:hypothetical protein